jgi:serine phosphatase RsbU (regulator of sigma subunit)
VLALGLLVTAGASTVAWVAYGRNEDRLLRQRVAEAAAVLDSALPALQTPLAAAAELAEATQGDPASFRRLMRGSVGAERTFASASLWQRDETAPIAIVGPTPHLAGADPARIRRFLDRAATAATLTVTSFLEDPQPRLGYGFTFTRTGARYLAYAESSLPRDRTQVVRPESAFADLDYAIYLGPRERDSRLLVASTPDIPLSGRRADRTTPFGDAELLLVMSPQGRLGGPLLGSLWWLLAVTGILLTVGATAITERLLRHRDQANELAAENERLYADQRSIAETLQHSLLPQRLPTIAGVAVGACYRPASAGADIGGDWYDTVVLDDHRLAIVIGDVSGHGLSAATAMASVRFAIRGFLTEGHGPAAVLERLSPMLDVSEGTFATVLCAVFDAGTGQLTAASAGHFPPLLAAEGTVAHLDLPVGVPIGVRGAANPVETTVALPPAGALFLFTDGLVERRGEDLRIGLERLQSAVSATEAADDDVGRVVDALASPNDLDDVAVLAIRWTAQRAGSIA